MMHWIHKKLFACVLMSELCLLLTCSAAPTDVDVSRVREAFLVRRFYAAGDARGNGVSDYDLFLLSCEEQRVDCDAVMDRLRVEDPDFLATIQAASAR